MSRTAPEISRKETLKQAIIYEAETEYFIDDDILDKIADDLDDKFTYDSIALFHCHILLMMTLEDGYRSKELSYNFQEFEDEFYNLIENKLKNIISDHMNNEKLDSDILNFLGKIEDEDHGQNYLLRILWGDDPFNDLKDYVYNEYEDDKYTEIKDKIFK